MIRLCDIPHASDHWLTKYERNPPKFVDVTELTQKNMLELEFGLANAYPTFELMLQAATHHSC